MMGEVEANEFPMDKMMVIDIKAVVLDHLWMVKDCMKMNMMGMGQTHKII